MASNQEKDKHPVIVAELKRQGVAEFLVTTLLATTSGFQTMMTDFLATPEKLAHWFGTP